MKIIICHHHLKKGGVTQVILSQLQALSREDFEIVLLLGEKPDIKIPAKVLVHPLMGYFDSSMEENTDEKILSLIHFLEKQGENDFLFHFHNLNLGKNPLVNLAVHGLLRRGHKVVNHCHDFAEDFRLENLHLLKRIVEEKQGYLLPEILYPAFKQYAYIAINGRDFHAMKNKGLPVHYLPNAVEEVVDSPTNGDKLSLAKTLRLDPSKAWVLYPVRGIRRKNIGELILLAELFPELQFIQSLAPENKSELKFFKRWLSLNRELGSPVCLDAGKKVAFNSLYQKVGAVVNTSVCEGFGMVFLEPWLRGKALCGRKIPAICEDFENAGLSLSQLYTSIKVPTELFDFIWPIQQKERYHSLLEGPLTLMNKSLSPSQSKMLKKEKLGSTADFASLTSEHQEDFIKALREIPGLKDLVFRKNPGLKKLLLVDKKQIAKNAATVKRRFSHKKFSQDLSRLYKRMSKMKNSGRTANVRINWPLSESFLASDNLYLIRGEQS